LGVVQGRDCRTIELHIPRWIRSQQSAKNDDPWGI
jgi:hypothetical protein